MTWQICEPCRIGLINKISIIPEWQGQGLGRRLIVRALADGPGFDWRTTGQSDDGRPFFAALSAELGVELATRGRRRTCDHLDHDEFGMPYPRPVLDRSV